MSIFFIYDSDSNPIAILYEVKNTFGEQHTYVFKIGIKNKQAALKAKKNGLNVIMDKCPKIENQRLFGELRVAGFNTNIISSKIEL